MFKGCLVALVTPFKGGGIDFGAFDRLVDHVLEGGVDGLVPCGTTGESPTLTAEEARQLIAAAVKRADGKAPVIAGSGTNCTERTLEACRVAADAGASGLMLVAPYYNRPNQQGLYEHFGQVAERVSLPIMLYNIPGRTGVEISVETIGRLRDDHANIAAVKHATGSIDGASELSRTSDIAILSGDDTMTVPLMSIGAVGVVSVLANLLPREMSAMTAAAAAGHWEEARSRHAELFGLASQMLRLDTNPIPIKTALAIRGMMAEEFRLPMCRLDGVKKKRLEALLAQHPCKTVKATRQPA